jgi:HSP20 family protein
MPWDPMRDLLTMHERLESLFGSTAAGWVPPVDLSESPDRYVLTLEIPGLARADIKISVIDGTLTVRGERSPESCCPERYHQLERGHGPFSRAFRFTSPVDEDAVTAELVDGVLTILVPKRPPAGRGLVDVE